MAVAVSVGGGVLSFTCLFRLRRKKKGGGGSERYIRVQAGSEGRAELEFYQ